MSEAKPPLTLTAAIADAAARLAELPSAHRDAELLLLRAINKDRAFLLTHPDLSITPEQQASFEPWLDRRAQHEPIQYILGEQEFYGLAFKVTPDVLIPRPETEHLVEALIERVNKGSVRIVDVGTGSGAIAVALAHSLPNATITALDISQPSLAIARENATRHGVANSIRFLESDLLAAVQGETFDAIVSNPPYVPDSEILEQQVRDFEPSTALYAGATGLDIYQRLIPQAWNGLKSGGWLLMEIGHGQRDSLADLLTSWDLVEFVDDLQGIPRVAVARRT